MGLAMFELNNAFAPLEIFTIDGRLVNGPVLDGDLAVGSVLTHHRDLGVTAALLDKVSFFLKLNGARLYKLYFEGGRCVVVAFFSTHRHR